MLATCMNPRNCPWKNGTTRAWSCLIRSNTDVQHADRIPIVKETHESCCDRACADTQTLQHMLRETQLTQNQLRGYFGGYMAKNVLVGYFEGAALEQAMRHLMDKHADEPIAQQMRRATQRLITDVHSKGIARGAVEGINLLTRRRDHDALAAEGFRTF